MLVKMMMIPGGQPGKAGKIQVTEGEHIGKGQKLIQIETGKGNQAIKSPVDGYVTKIFLSEGDQVSSNQELFELTETEIKAKETDTSETRETSAETLSESQENEKAQDIHTDLLIIGGGPGGYTAAIYGSRLGRKVTLVEQGDLGGTCLHIGCIPTKAMIKSSEVMDTVRNAGEFGIITNGTPSVDMKQIQERKEQIVSNLTTGIGYLMTENKIQVIKGKASFISENKVQVLGNKEYHLTFQNLILSTGSVTANVTIPGMDAPFVWDSTKALEAQEVPDKLTIIGGGVIGLELAFLYQNLGSEVTVVEFMDRLLPMVDEEASATMKKLAKKKGIHIELGAKVTQIQQTVDKTALVIFEQRDATKYAVSDAVIVATGRKPNTEGLLLEHTKIKMNDRGRGIWTNDFLQTSVPQIYAIGDVNNKIQLAHAASHQGIVAVDHMQGKKDPFKVEWIPSVIFTSPEVASVGLTEEQARQRGITFKVGRFDFRGNGKAVIMGQGDGYCKLLQNEDGVVIGGTVIGPDASTLIDTLSMAVRLEIKGEDLSRVVMPHPTTGEVIYEASMDLSVGALNR